jgi:FkbM family methyltransferase
MFETIKSGARAAMRAILPVLPRGRTRLIEGLGPWLAPQGGVEVRAIGGYAVRLNHGIRATKLMAYGVYESREIRLLRKLLKPGDVVLDVGANVGYLAAHFAACVSPGGKVYAFEPAPTCVEHLREMGASSVRQVIQFVPAAVGNVTGTVTYYETANIVSHGFGRIRVRPSDRHRVTHELEVPIFRLDDYCREQGIGRVDFVKIDVEGAELDVVEGMAGLFQAGVKPGLLTEVTLQESAPPELLALRERLLAEGYRCYCFRDGRLAPCDPAALPPGTHDNVFWFVAIPAGLGA